MFFYVKWDEIQWYPLVEVSSNVFMKLSILYWDILNISFFCLQLIISRNLNQYFGKYTSSQALDKKINITLMFVH